MPLETRDDELDSIAPPTLKVIVVRPDDKLAEPADDEDDDFDDEDDDEEEEGEVEEEETRNV